MADFCKMSSRISSGRLPLSMGSHKFSKIMMQKVLFADEYHKKFDDYSLQTDPFKLQQRNENYLQN